MLIDTDRRKRGWSQLPEDAPLSTYHARTETGCAIASGGLRGSLLGALAPNVLLRHHAVHTRTAHQLQP